MSKIKYLKSKIKIYLIYVLNIFLLLSFSIFAEESTTDEVVRNPFLSPIEELLKEDAPVKEMGGDEGEILLLSGTLRTESRSVAIINNAIVREGEMISGFKVELIERKSVLVSKDGERYILRMSSGEQGEEQ
ncbi:MAG TPA: hypothetical protein EYP78_00245 [Candidatus Omnitrophica bacterium]|nr:hypothetical protein [Candidatus Omnitrophota bacterium]